MYRYTYTECSVYSCNWSIPPTYIHTKINITVCECSVIDNTMLSLYQSQLSEYTYILASASPQRIHLIHTLLPELNNNITVSPSRFNEDLDQSQHTPYTYVINTSYCKCVDVYHQLNHTNTQFTPSHVIISADTIVVDQHSNIIEKSDNDEHAYNTLNQLQGTTHHVITAVTLMKSNRSTTQPSVYNLINTNDSNSSTQSTNILHNTSLHHLQPSNTTILQFTVSTAVTFASLTSDEIRAYVSTQQYRGKAGAYGIQGTAVC